MLAPPATAGSLSAPPRRDGMCCIVVSDPGELGALADPRAPAEVSWAGLQQRAARNEITQSPDWLLTWWEVYGRLAGRRLRLGLFHEAGRLVGLAPLVWRRHWYRGVLPFRRLELLASGEPADDGIYSNHVGVLAEAGAEERVARRLVEAVCGGAFGPWDEIVLPMMSGDTPLPGLLRDAFRTAGVPAELTQTARAPYVALPASWDEYLRGLSGGGRRSVQRSLAAFDSWAGGTMRLEGVSGPAELARGKEVLVRLHRERWAGLGEGGVFRSPLYLRFHDALMDRLLRRGALELLWLSGRGEPAAVLYGMAWAGKVYAYQTGRRTDLPGRLRPGGVLLALAIRRAIEAGRREFDLLADEAPYKSQLAPTSRPLVRLRAARPSLREVGRRALRSLTSSGR